MIYKTARCRDIYNKLAYTEPTGMGEAIQLYGRLMPKDIFSRPVIKLGGQDGFQYGRGINFHLPNWRIYYDYEGKPVNLTFGQKVDGLALTYVKTMQEDARVILLSDATVEDSGWTVDVTVTLDPDRAKYILIAEYFYHTEKIPKLPLHVRRSTEFIFEATRTVDENNTIRYSMFRYSYPYTGKALEPIITSYRNQLYEQHLEQYFQLGGEIDETPKEATEQEYCSYHFEDKMSREQAFAILANGRILKPTVNDDDIEVELYDGAKIAQMETWADLPEDAWIVKYKCMSYNEQHEFSFLKRGTTLYVPQVDRMQLLTHEMDVWECARFNDVKIKRMTHEPTTSAKPWQDQLHDEGVKVQSLTKNLREAEVPETESIDEHKGTERYDFETGV